MGDASPQRADRVQRAGKKPVTPDSFVNKNVKEANEEREGIKHIGGLKTGGRAKKMVGGPMEGAQKMMQRAQAVGDVPGATMNFSPIKKGSLSPARGVGLKKGGMAKHEDVAEDKALIKKMVKPSARTGKDDGGALAIDFKNAQRPSEQSEMSEAASSVGRRLSGGNRGQTPESYEPEKRGGRAKRATGGQVFSGSGYPDKIPGVVPGGRTARATGGRSKGKGKTNINIIIGAGKPAGAADMMGNPMGGPTKPPGMDGMPGGMPVAVPPPGGAPGAAPMPMPMPIPMPGPAGPAGPPGMPMPRKSGGRAYRSYQDMDAGAGSGKGRLEKAEIAESKRSARKVGGRTYSSYKDMDAGSGGGKGRLEKAEIASKTARIESGNY
jgi:hypothetical protein